MTTSKRDLEQRSSAMTLSDMEIFVFPDLMYALLLANIMSPRIWRWRDDPWFDGLARMKPYRRITRLKQFIMDHYAFNLDLDTWGLTTKQRELSRFSDFIDEATLAQSNALFGYEGDKYYFDLDIRTHFGLNKYTTDTIPYWKTETVEAMDAFRYKAGYSSGAGECVSLSALYAAALFIVAGIPLRDIYLMATPLHSQNYVDVDDGILTNNRRLVTKKMWCNGTALSAQARRALENEQVTIVSHDGGYIHTIDSRATIDPAAYERFSRKLRSFLHTPLTDEVLGNFLRHSRDMQRCFQLRHNIRGSEGYVPLETAFQYEEGSSYLVTDNTREPLMADIDMEEFSTTRIQGRIVLNDLETFVRQEKPDLTKAADVRKMKDQFACDCLNAEWAMENLIRFCRVEPRLPEAAGRQFVGADASLAIEPSMTREAIIGRLASIRAVNPAADLAFYAFRDLSRIEPEPFVKAAIERSPVSLSAFNDHSDEAALEAIRALPNESIYDGPARLAQPDEVWNYGRGDGAEKALLAANVLHARHPEEPMHIAVEPGRAALHAGNRTVEFPSSKELQPQEWIVSPRLEAG